MIECEISTDSHHYWACEHSLLTIVKTLILYYYHHHHHHYLITIIIITIIIIIIIIIIITVIIIIDYSTATKTVPWLTFVNSSNVNLVGCCRSLLLKMLVIIPKTWSSVNEGPVTILNKLNSSLYDKYPSLSVSSIWNATRKKKPVE